MVERKGRVFIEYNKHSGDVISTMTLAGNLGMDILGIKREYPERDVLVISEEDFKKMEMTDLACYKIRGNKVEMKSDSEIKKIKKIREKWVKTSTISGLSEQVENLKKEVEILKKAKIQEEIK